MPMEACKSLCYISSVSGVTHCTGCHISAPISRAWQLRLLTQGSSLPAGSVTVLPAASLTRATASFQVVLMQQAVTPDLQGPDPCNREKPMLSSTGPYVKAALCWQQAFLQEICPCSLNKGPCWSSAAAHLQMAPWRQAALVPCRRSEPGHSVGSHGPPRVPFML